MKFGDMGKMPMLQEILEPAIALRVKREIE
jgi:hypothetical protein